METPIVHSSLVTDATIASGGQRSGEAWAWAFVRLLPTRGLTLGDLEARFDGHRHGIDLATVHGTHDGLRSIRHVNHRFEVDGGTLVASVSPDSVLVVQLVVTIVCSLTAGESGRVPSS